ncbi:hypothetical protein CASFOL_026878 [Castilleja foliolosa]|uniref:C2H2-type domain-containing protein n=1 Tax=Castilleja foliolosa TaxID=1961234 RepID=A0ABD3CJZ4_9LAMI
MSEPAVQLTLHSPPFAHTLRFLLFQPFINSRCIKDGHHMFTVSLHPSSRIVGGGCIGSTLGSSIFQVAVGALPIGGGCIGSTLGSSIFPVPIGGNSTLSSSIFPVAVGAGGGSTLSTVAVGGGCIGSILGSSIFPVAVGAVRGGSTLRNSVYSSLSITVGGGCIGSSTLGRSPLSPIASSCVFPAVLGFGSQPFSTAPETDPPITEEAEPKSSGSINDPPSDPFAGLFSTADNKDEPIKPFVCEPCKKEKKHRAFKSRDALYNHIRNDHEATHKKGHKCKRCFNFFETKQQLDAHVCPMKGFNTPDELLKALSDAKLIEEQKAFDEKVAAMTKEQASEAKNEAWKVAEKAGLALEEARKAKESADNPTAVDAADKALEKATTEMDNAYNAYNAYVKALNKLYENEKKARATANEAE